jgi:hypothetical protein
VYLYAWKEETLMAAVRSWSAVVLFVLILCVLPTWAWAHGFAGQRFFPTTLAIDDPFVSDELSFLFRHIKEPGQGEEPATVSTEIAAEYTKRLTPRLGLSLGGTFRHLAPDEGDTDNGFGNLEVGAKYQLVTSASAEALLSVGLSAEVGGTGSRSVGAESFSTLSPGLFFGKGFGDLPATVPFLRPFALTGVLAGNIPTSRETVTTRFDPDSGTFMQDIERHPVTLSWGVTLQYNLQYLQAFVKDIGLGAPFNRMIPLVELALETCLNRGCGGQTTGTVNPGVIWFGKYLQLGVEAIIPINERTGKNVGVLGLVHFFIDDLFPHSLGRPLFP